jgi:hypothetical protein
MQKTGWRAAVVVALALALMFALEATSARLKSPTYDEQGYIARGYAYVKLNDRHILIGTPMMLNAWNALPLLALPDVNLETDHPTWEGTDFHDVGSHFLWESGNDVDQVVFWARVPTMILSLLLAATVYRWARELYGPRAGWLALFLAILSPNVLAHARLATTDLGLAFFFFLATYRLWRYLEAQTWTNLAWAGVALGLLQGTKFSALLIAPVWVAIGAAWLFAGERQEGESWPRRALSLALAGVGMIAIGFFVLWATYGFEMAPLTEGGPPVPAATHFRQWMDISGRLAGEVTRRAPAFLMGQCSDTGWWYYFPVAFLLKTPLPALILLLWAVPLSFRRPPDAAPRLWRRELAIVLPPLIYFAFSLTSKLNLGYRYLLPVLPFLFVYASKIANRNTQHAIRNTRYVICAVLIGWYAFGSVLIYPHFLAYFNELAGGPEGGWRFLVDSNIDWGQDAILLQRYLDERGVDRVKLAWFGESRPEYYGLGYEPLPGWPPNRENVATRTFSPVAPAPGMYAISITSLQGVLLDDHDTYAWFREKEPVDKIGYSVFVYEVPRWGAGDSPVDVALSGVGVDQLGLDAFEVLGTNDVALRWFDARSSLVFPQDGGGWYAVAEGMSPDPALATRFWVHAEDGDTHRTRDGATGYRLYRLSGPGDLASLAADSPVWWSPATAFPTEGFERYELPLPVNLNGIVELVGYKVSPAKAQPGDPVTLLTYWRVQQGSDRPLKVFAHLLDEASQVQSGQDRLEIAPAGWHKGDILMQAHHLALPGDVAPGEYQLEIGWYDGETLARLPVLDEGGAAVADRMLLASVQVGK